VLLASWFLLAERGKEARITLERFTAEDPKHPDGYLLNANFAFNEGRITDSILSCQAALQFAADARFDAELRKRFVRDARQGLAACFEQRGDMSSLKEQLTGLLNDDPKNGQLRGRLAAATFHTGKPEEAFAEFQKAFTDDPAVDPPELRIAQLWTGKGERDKAEDWLKKAISAHATNPKTHRAYAGFLLDEGKIDAAQLYLEAALKHDPKARESAALQALMVRHKRDYAAAEVAFELLHKDAPGDPFALGNLAIVLMESKDEKKMTRAVELAESLVKQNNRAADAYAVLGYCYFKAGRVDDADKVLGTAASTGQVGLDTAYYLALVLNEKKKYPEAQKILTEAVGARGAFVYRAEAKALLTEVAKKVPEKKDEPKK
jgi:tetratricopeptide (TPR) repeat protein